MQCNSYNIVIVFALPKTCFFGLNGKIKCQKPNASFTWLIDHLYDLMDNVTKAEIWHAISHVPRVAELQQSCSNSWNLFEPCGWNQLPCLFLVKLIPGPRKCCTPTAFPNSTHRIILGSPQISLKTFGSIKLRCLKKGWRSDGCFLQSALVGQTQCTQK